MPLGYFCTFGPLTLVLDLLKRFAKSTTDSSDPRSRSSRFTSTSSKPSRSGAPYTSLSSNSNSNSNQSQCSKREGATTCSVKVLKMSQHDVFLMTEMTATYREDRTSDPLLPFLARADLCVTRNNFRLGAHDAHRSGQRARVPFS